LRDEVGAQRAAGEDGGIVKIVVEGIGTRERGLVRKSKSRWIWAITNGTAMISETAIRSAATPRSAVALVELNCFGLAWARALSLVSSVGRRESVKLPSDVGGASCDFVSPGDEPGEDAWEAPEEGATGHDFAGYEEQSHFHTQ